MKIPKARKLKTGGYAIRLRLNGQDRTIRANTLRRCQQEATLAKAEMLQETRRPSKTVKEVIDQYIERRSAVLSPSTIRGYRIIQRNRFKLALERPISGLFDWQGIVNAEASLCSPHTLKNAWGLVSAALAEEGIRPRVRLPQIPRNERSFLQPEEIPVFLEAIKGDKCELDALLALHGLRRSEILAIRPEDIGEEIIVRAAVVPDEKNVMTRKETTKTASSTRKVPVLIPRLRDVPFIHLRPDTTFAHINRACRKAGLPEVGFHGLRHTFASLCYSLRLSELETQRLGGWSDAGTMRKIYTHLAEADRTAGERKLAAFFGDL